MVRKRRFIRFVTQKDVDWKKHKVDIVIESTGKFTEMPDMQKHLDAGAKKVLVTAPCSDRKFQIL